MLAGVAAHFRFFPPNIDIESNSEKEITHQYRREKRPSSIVFGVKQCVVFNPSQGLWTLLQSPRKLKEINKCFSFNANNQFKRLSAD